VLLENGAEFVVVVAVPAHTPRPRHDNPARRLRAKQNWNRRWWLWFTRT